MQTTAAQTKTQPIKITVQEQSIIDYCLGKKTVAWEELVQFAKDPQTVKLRTLQKVVSDLRKKYRDAGAHCPVVCSFVSLLSVNQTVAEETKPEPVEQTIVKLRITKGGNKVRDDDTRSDAQIDFVLDSTMKRVKTRTNVINLSDNEWELFKLFHDNVGKPLSMEEIKNVVYAGFGSKTPHNWSEAIKRTLTKLRTNIRELKTDNRLVCVVGGNLTSYMLQ